MKSLLELATALLRDVGEECGAPTRRDVLTLRARVEHEGDSFLTITLPAYCSDFERGLDEGRLSATAFRGLSHAKGRKYPAFLQGFFKHVFDRDGVLRDDASADCVSAVRQFLLFCKKVERPCSPERNARAVEAYVACEAAVPEDLSEVPEDLLVCVDRVVSIIWKMSDGLDPSQAELPCQHGPGVTTDRRTGNGKWRFDVWPERLYEVGFTPSLALYGKESALWGEPTMDPEDAPRLLCPEDEAPVKVVFVPKTLKTPRVIAVESTAMQFAQQGLYRWLRRVVESHPILNGSVEFRTQQKHRDLVLDASKTGHLATLDLSEASDRVSLALVRRVFARTEFLRWAEACRTRRALLPTGETLELRKFASMGSALTFPVEALAFFVIAVSARLVKHGVYVSETSIAEMAKEISVFGDDIICPVDDAPTVCAGLEAFGLKVNVRKSFWKGQFRESCGMDAFRGVPVTPVYLRKDVPAHRGDVSGILSTVASANFLYLIGKRRTADLLRKEIERLLGRLPEVPFQSPAIGWYDPSKVKPLKRWNCRLQREEYLHWFATTKVENDPLEGNRALAKCFRVVGREEPLVDVEGVRFAPEWAQSTEYLHDWRVLVPGDADHLSDRKSVV